MPAIQGDTVVVQVDISGTMTKIAAQRGGTLNLEADVIDTTTKDQNAWEQALPGRRRWSIDCDALLIQDDAALGVLRTSFKDRTILIVEMKFQDNKVFRGNCYVTSIPHEAPYDDAASYAVTFTGDGEPTKYFENP